MPHSRAKPTIALMGAYGDIIELCSLMNSPTAKAGTGQHWYQEETAQRNREISLGEVLSSKMLIDFPLRC